MTDSTRPRSVRCAASAASAAPRRQAVGASPGAVLERGRLSTPPKSLGGVESLIGILLIMTENAAIPLKTREALGISDRL